MDENVKRCVESVQNMKDQYFNKADGKTGFKNPGASCYANSALQLIMHSNDLMYYFMSQEYKREIPYKTAEDIEVLSMKRKKEINVLDKFYNLTLQYWYHHDIENPLKKELFAKDLMNAHQFIDGRFSMLRQQDSQEYLSSLIDILHESMIYSVEINASGEPENEIDILMLESIKEWSKSFANKYSKFVELFYGQHCNFFQCKVCDHKKDKNFDPFNILALSINDLPSNDLYGVFQKYITPEDLVDDNGLDCENCHKRQDFTRTDYILKIPQYLFIQLKRFEKAPRKINTRIELTNEIYDFKEYIVGYEEDSAIYKITGAVCHHGGCGGGHYIALTESIDGKWYLYNDSDVIEVDLNDALNHMSDHGYLLMLKRVTDTDYQKIIEC